MENRHQKIVRALECRIKALERELAQIRRDMAAARENWFEVFEEPEGEFNRKLSAANKKARQMEKRALKAGHEGHCRKKQVPTGEPVLLTPPQEVLENPDFKKTSKTIVKQMVNIRLVLEVTQYHADVYYNSKTGERIHAQFPAGVTDEVNYGGSIKAFLSLLNNECCTSLDKSRRFLSDLTDSKP